MLLTYLDKFPFKTDWAVVKAKGIDHEQQGKSIVGSTRSLLPAHLKEEDERERV